MRLVGFQVLAAEALAVAWLDYRLVVLQHSSQPRHNARPARKDAFLCQAALPSAGASTGSMVAAVGATSARRYACHPARPSAPIPNTTAKKSTTLPNHGMSVTSPSCTRPSTRLHAGWICHLPSRAAKSPTHSAAA